MTAVPGQAPSTSAKVLQFLEETQISEDMAQATPPEKSGQKSSHPSQNQASPAAGIDNNNNKYKNMLRYKPNTGFQDEVSSINGISVPNTFKHKSHPNARTKPQIGTSIHETSAECGLDSVLDELSEPAIKTSTLQAKKATLDDEHTPNWMPSVLETRWDEQSPADQPETSKKEMPLSFLNQESNTFVHNANANENGHVTPMWKKVQDGYQHQIASAPPVRNIFQSYFDQSKESKAGESKTGDSAFTSMSSFSTPVATKDSENHLTEQQIVQLENMLEQVKDQPDDYPVVGSPLKLFGNQYDTFTKSVLNQFVEKVRSNANSVQRQPAPSLLPKFELRISSFTKSKDYTDKDFMKNADNLFAHLQKKGADNHLFEKTSADSFHHPSFSQIQSQNTATSTPKPNKIRSFSSSSSPQMTMESTDAPPTVNRAYEYEYSVDDYTTEEKTSFGHGLSEAPKHTLSELSEINSEYTSESESEFSRQAASEVDTSGSKHSSHQSPSPLFGSSMSSVRKFPRENRKIQGETTASRASSRTDQKDFIKWKRPSQLRLSSASNVRPRHNSTSSVVKGHVNPGDFPDHYGNMVLDPQKNRWVSNDKENTFRGSLDSIEDLATSLESQKEDLSMIKRPHQSRKSDQNLEVSFQLPESSFGTSNRSHLDVTAVSALANNTFSQSNKEIVSLITGSTDEAAWEKISTIDLSGKNITHLKSLDSYLPSLRSVNLSQNKLAFIEGLPDGVSELDVSGNVLDARASFGKFRDLQVLNASFNCLETFSGLASSHNLTQLNLSGNLVRSLDDLRPLRSLITLNVSRNKLYGKLNLAKFDFANLQELNLAENSVSSLVGLEHVPKLRVLNANENKLSQISCVGRHKKLKKLCVKFNALRSVNVQDFPFLRVLRMDGNQLEAVHGLNKLRYLQELSAKCQASEDVAEALVLGASDVFSMDLSGVSSVSQLLQKNAKMTFCNLNVLSLSAVGLTSLPAEFGQMFPNVRELNLSFNRFENISGLSSLTRLRKLYLLSNNMSSMEDILTSLQNCRKSLLVLDLRLNALNFRFYPYVFSPDELEHRSDAKDLSESPIPIHAVDDIENFTIHYKAVMRSKEDWQDRDRAFFSALVKNGYKQNVQDRISYESLLLEFFGNLRELDGTRVVEDSKSSRRMQERNSMRNR